MTYEFAVDFHGHVAIIQQKVRGVFLEAYSQSPIAYIPAKPAPKVMLSRFRPQKY